MPFLERDERFRCRYNVVQLAKVVEFSSQFLREPQGSKLGDDSENVFSESRTYSSNQFDVGASVLRVENFVSHNFHFLTRTVCFSRTRATTSLTCGL